MLNLVNFARRYALPLWFWYLVGLLFLALTNMITVKIPEIASEITDAFFHDDTSLLKNLAQSIIGLGFLQIVCRSLSRIFIFWPGRQIEAKSKADLFQHTMSLPLEFLNTLGIGDLISRLSNDLGQLRVFFAFGMLQIFNLLFLSVFTISQMWEKSPKLTLLSLSPVLLMVFISRYMMPRLTRCNREQQMAVGSLTNRVTEAFASTHLIKTQGVEEVFSKLCESEVTDVYKANIRLLLVRTLLFPLIGSLAAISQVIILLIGGFEVLEGRLTVGDILAFNIYVVALAFPVTSLGIIMSIYQRAITALERLRVVDQVPSETGLIEGRASRPTAEILIKNLTYKYKSSNRVEPALSGVSLEIFKGEKIGICGPIGSGKSTLFSLILRIYDPPEGSIFLNGVDALGIHPQEIRRKICYTLQDPHLFSNSIYGNLGFGLEGLELSKHQFDEALKKAAVLDDVERFANGPLTEIGEKGIRLSGGQKQRLALARALLRASDILILDDTLSAIDAEKETEILDHLFADSRTLLIASHRHGPLERCDRVYYFEAGAIKAQGSFRDLCVKYPEIGRSHVEGVTKLG